jgi:hypothetical protein
MKEGPTMNNQTRLSVFAGPIPWLLGLVLICTSCASLRVVTPTPPLVVADFNSCTGVDNLGGAMGAAFNPPDGLTESFAEQPNRGCVARLEYNTATWSAFWLKLQGADLRPYDELTFDVRADPQPGIPGQMKLEFKRASEEVSVVYVSGIVAEWKTISVKLRDFAYAGYGKPVSTWSDMQELVFTFEASRSGNQGVVYLDHIVLVKR